MTDVEKAEKIVADLEMKRGRLLDRGKEIGDQIAANGFKVHAENDKTARSELDKLTAASVSHQAETKSPEAAIKQAGERLDAVKRSAAPAEDQTQARELRQALKEFVAFGLELDAALAVIVDSGTRLRKTADKLLALGSPNPTHEQLNALGALALHTALSQTPWSREFRTLAPRERKSFADLVRAWASTAERAHVAPRLGEQQNNEAAA
jgi:hypothetical protein